MGLRSNPKSRSIFLILVLSLSVISKPKVKPKSDVLRSLSQSPNSI